MFCAESCGIINSPSHSNFSRHVSSKNPKNTSRTSPTHCYFHVRPEESSAEFFSSKIRPPKDNKLFFFSGDGEKIKRAAHSDKRICRKRRFYNHLILRWEEKRTLKRDARARERVIFHGEREKRKSEVAYGGRHARPYPLTRPRARPSINGCAARLTACVPLAQPPVTRLRLAIPARHTI